MVRLKRKYFTSVRDTLGTGYSNPEYRVCRGCVGTVILCTVNVKYTKEDDNLTKSITSTSQKHRASHSSNHT